MSPLLALIIQELPQIFAFIREVHQDANPNAPVPTDEEVMAALTQAVTSSEVVDAAWLASHPDTGGGNG